MRPKLPKCDQYRLDIEVPVDDTPHNEDEVQQILLLVCHQADAIHRMAESLTPTEIAHLITYAAGVSRGREGDEASMRYTAAKLVIDTMCATKALAVAHVNGIVADDQHRSLLFSALGVMGYWENDGQHVRNAPQEFRDALATVRKLLVVVD